MKIQGVRSVDFKIMAKGEGIVNWNGSFNIYNDAADKRVDNHILPKMRNVDPMRLNSLNSVELNKAQIFVSQNCIRNHLFKNESHQLMVVNTKNIKRVLMSILGLVRGYVVADAQTSLSLKRKSALLLEDFVAQNSTVRYEQFSNSGERNETSLHSKTQGDHLDYLAYGSLSVEDLQFIVLEDTFSRSSYSDIISEADGKELANEMTAYLKTLDFEGKYAPSAVFGKNFIRKGGIMNTGEAGLLLNDDAVHLVIREVLSRLEQLFVRQSKGYLTVTGLLVDYNNGRAMRIKSSESSINVEKSEAYAVYYSDSGITEEDYLARQKELQAKRAEQKKLKDARLERERKERKKKEDAKKAREAEEELSQSGSSGG